MNSKKYLLLFILTVSLIFFFQSGETFVPAEGITIISSFGIDLLEVNGEERIYSAPIASYNYGTAPEIKTSVVKGRGETIGQAMTKSQFKLDKKLLLSLEKLYIIGEGAAKLGIMPVMDLTFQNTNINDNAYLIVTGEKVQDLMNLKIDNFPNSSDYIEGLLKHSIEQNFIPNKYELRYVHHYLIGEGNNLVSPYVEIVGDIPTITGMALFKGDKMVRKIGIKESKAMNILRESNVRGNISIRKNLKEYVDVYINSKRKVKVNREEEKYKFEINLNIEGYVISNLLYENIMKNPESIKKIEKDVKEEVERMTGDFIDKMQNDYKVDCLNLGEDAAAKYGRDKGTDWNEIVANADIKVNTKVKISIKTRGQLK